MIESIRGSMIADWIACVDYDNYGHRPVLEEDNFSISVNYDEKMEPVDFRIRTLKIKKLKNMTSPSFGFYRWRER